MNINQAFIKSTGLLTIATLIILLGIESYLFYLADYDVYRVINLSFRDLALLTIGCLVQYLILKKLLRFTKELAQQILVNRNKLGLLFFIGLAGSIIYSLLSVQFPFWIFLVLFFAIFLATNFINYIIINPFQTIIFLLLFGASINSSLTFWMHEEGNKGKHTFYAQQLAEHRDMVAEKHLIEILQQGRNTSSDNLKSYQFWERLWLKNYYLRTNYYFSITQHPTTIDSLSAAFYEPILTINEENVPSYQVFLSDNEVLNFRLNNQFRRSIYTSKQAYKNLEDLNDFHFAVVENDQIIRSNSSVFDPFIFEATLLKIGQIQKMNLDGFDAKVYRHNKNTVVMIGEPLSEVQVWVANFGFFFTIYLGVALFWEIITLLFSKKNLLNYWQSYPIQYKIQIILIVIICALFFIIAATTFLFLNQNHGAVSNERQRYISETLNSEIKTFLQANNQQKTTIPTSFLRNLAYSKQCDIDVFDREGKLINSSFATVLNMPNLPVLQIKQIEQLAKNPSLILVEQLKTTSSQEPYLRTFFGIYDNDKLSKIFSVSNLSSTIGTAPYIPFVMSKLLSVYVFLLLLAWGGGLFLINLLTKPLQMLAISLSNFRLEKQNEKLEWNGNDAVGQLIEEYNLMVDKVEITTKELIQREREGAWQIMAKQIAHEINNKLTPIQLNAQFLTRLVSQLEPSESTTIQGVTNKLVYKIGGLSKIAKQFSLFAKLETPQIESVIVADYLKEFLGNYSQKQNIVYTIDINDIQDAQVTINIDKGHLQEVLSNLVINAENALEEQANGSITLRLTTVRSVLQLGIIDNGKKITDGKVSDIFDPTFTTNTSQTGLGLPICKRIIEFYNGELNYKNIGVTGNCFTVILPK